MNWLLKLMTDCLADIMLAMVDKMGSLLDNIFENIWRISEGMNFTKLSNYAVTLALAFVVLCAIKQGLDVYVFQTEGDADADPMELITRCSIAVAVIYCGNYMLQQLIAIAGKISSDVLERVSDIDSGEEAVKFSGVFGKVVNLFYSGSGYKAQTISFVMILVCGAMLLASIIFIVHAAKRGAELILFQFLMPLMATDLLSTNKERWNAFKNELILCVFGYILQVLSFNIFTHILAAGVDKGDELIFYMLAALGWLLVVISTPKWLEKFLYTSGVGNGIKGGVRNAAFVVPQLLRK